jgi:hypothetical protein
MKRLITIIYTLFAFNYYVIAQDCPPLTSDVDNITKALALVTHATSGFQFTGALVNNSNEDGKYYFITSSYPFRTECDEGDYNGSSYPDIEFRWWFNNELTYGAILKTISGEIALLELTSPPPFEKISYLGIKSSGGTPSYCLNYYSANSSFPYLANSIVNNFASAKVTTICNSVADSYNFSSSASNAFKIIRWGGFDNLNSDKWAKGAPLLDNNERIIGVFVTKRGSVECDVDSAYFSMSDYSQIESYLGSSDIRAIEIDPCRDEEIISNPIISGPQNIKASITVIGKSKISSGAVVTFSAGTSVILENGFESGNEFIAEIKPCVAQINPLSKTINELEVNLKNRVEEKIIDINKDVNAYPSILIDNEITIKSEGLNYIQYYLVNLQGQVLLKNNYFPQNNKSTTKIDLPYLTLGIYLLYINDGQYSKTIKLIKK